MALLELAEGGQLYYEWIGGHGGAAGKPVLVFLHEGLGCAAMWKDFSARLCAQAGCEGLVYDRRGYGQSVPLAAGRSVHYLHRYALEELPQVLALLGGRPYVVLGHSDGGSIALIHAADQPPGLAGVVTEAAHVFVEDVTLAGIREARAAYDAGKLRGLSRYHGAKTDQIFGAWADTWLRPAFGRWNIEYLLPSVTRPVLALQGSGDQYGTVAQLDAIAAQAPRARTAMLPDCGHTPHLEQPEAVLRAVAAFLKELEEK
ncbi:alpha/beta hydrolase [Massilia sp. Root418]|uniref:alpha/beta fold hydrolase n=1 Tax=Massilia sp. Root418 TaxID=1736532 RepID=UPI0006F3E6F3|nr:alpha/beta hydrolase [Massilia sp. Root418]KQW87467.1 alpha/beta hydrolase [Massilia sp. Root418]